MEITSMDVMVDVVAVGCFVGLGWVGVGCGWGCLSDL